jgi:arabinose-5-phosphate isomerase
MGAITCKECNIMCDENGFCFNPSCIRNISYKLGLYSKQVSTIHDSFEPIIRDVVKLLKECKNTIFITGIGKSSHITRKCVSTWQSLGINAHNLLIQDLFHGDIGILRENDIIIYITNSGNTEELLNASSYIKNKFNIFQICISNNPSAKLNTIVDKSYIICNFKIAEIDILNIVPSVSTVLFMILLDNIGIHLSDLCGFNKEKFKLYHPGGDIGQKI